jgi:acetyl esterase/lipase
LAGALGVIYFLSPDFSETVAEFVSSLSEEKGISVERDIFYATPHDKLRTGDLYTGTSGVGLRPAVVIVHGGSWSEGSKRDFAEVGIARFFARNGYAAFSIDYRLLPRSGEFPADIIDVKEALCYLASNAQHLRIDPQRLFVIGTSSGASAAMTASYTANTSDFAPSGCKHVPVTAVASISGPTDFTQESNNPHVQEYLKSKNQTPSQQSLLQASPKSYAATAVPTIFVHGTEDANVPISQATDLMRSLQEHSVPTSFVRVEGQSHFIGASSRRQCLAMVLSFFTQCPKTSRPFRPAVP